MNDDFELGFDGVDTPVETEAVTSEENVENVEETVDNVQPQEQTEEQKVQEEIQKLKIKYNHEEMELPIDEVQVLAQKGMNYDKLQERLHQVENHVGLKYLEELAERSGTDVEGLVNYWRNQEHQQELNQLIQNNIPEEYAKEIIENRKFRQQLQQKEAEAQRKEAESREFKDFLDTFPDVKPEEIPPEVWEKNNNGIPLKFAYMEHEMSKLKNEINVLKNNNLNKKKAVVNPIGNANDENYDAFLDGFNSY